MKQKILVLLLSIGVLFSCNKSDQRADSAPATNKQEKIVNNTAGKGGSFTLYSPNIQGVLKTMDFGSPTAYWPPAAGGFVNNFSLTLNCNNSTVLNLNQVVLFGSSFPDQIMINNTVFTLTFDFNIQPCVNVFKLLNITSIDIGADLNDPNTVLTFSYLFCDDPTGCPGGGTWQTGTPSYPLSQYACTSASAQCLGSSPATGQLHLYVPIPICIPPVFVAESYQFRYQRQEDNTPTVWTQTAVYPESVYRYAGITISNLTAGTYNCEGRNICSGTTGPWVPAISTVTVN